MGIQGLGQKVAQRPWQILKKSETGVMPLGFGQESLKLSSVGDSGAVRRTMSQSRVTPLTVDALITRINNWKMEIEASHLPEGEINALSEAANDLTTMLTRNNKNAELWNKAPKQFNDLIATTTPPKQYIDRKEGDGLIRSGNWAPPAHDKYFAGTRPTNSPLRATFGILGEFGELKALAQAIYRLRTQEIYSPRIPKNPEAAARKSALDAATPHAKQVANRLKWFDNNLPYLPYYTETH